MTSHWLASKWVVEFCWTVRYPAVRVDNFTPFLSVTEVLNKTLGGESADNGVLSPSKPGWNKLTYWWCNNGFFFPFSMWAWALRQWICRDLTGKPPSNLPDLSQRMFRFVTRVECSLILSFMQFYSRPVALWHFLLQQDPIIDISK